MSASRCDRRSASNLVIVAFYHLKHWLREKYTTLDRHNGTNQAGSRIGASIYQTVEIIDLPFEVFVGFSVLPALCRQL
jgi:hypothetical protein